MSQFTTGHNRDPIQWFWYSCW